MAELINFFRKSYTELFKETSLSEPTIMNIINTLKEAYNLLFDFSWWEL